ncbi:MAG: 2-iminoacetate synthase ThiH [bacterium]
MFSNSVKKTAFYDFKVAIEKATPSYEKIQSIVSRAQRLERLNMDDLLYLLNDGARNYIELIKEGAYNLTLQRHGRVVKFYAPIYVSNECNNKCVYCGFNSSNKMNRKTLTVEELLRESAVIKKMGIEHLLIVSGESLNNVGMTYLKEISSLLSKEFASISVEIAPLETDEYRDLFDRGVEGVLCYQETYNPEQYKSCHVSGPKTDMIRRLDTLDRAGASGMRFLGLAALLGLDDFKTEAFFLALHARYLEKKYWQSSISVSFPRIRPSESGFQPNVAVNDEVLLHVISVLRLFLPDSNLVLSTREAPSFRDKAIFYGINQMSAGSKTNPLGYSGESSSLYSKDKELGKQFEISDSRTPQEISAVLSKFGYDPVFKDWDRGFRNE